MLDHQKAAHRDGGSLFLRGFKIMAAYQVPLPLTFQLAARLENPEYQTLL